MKKKTKIVIAACVSLFLLVGIAGFLFLKQVRRAGGIRYLYNLKHDTMGLVSTEYYPEGLAGANGEADCTLQTAPSVLGITQTLRYEKDGETVTEKESYEFLREDTVSFEGDLITGTVEGLFTFRGNYHRNTTSYGTAQITKEQFAEKYWTFETGKLLKSGGSSYWSGNGWTGQPLIISWPKETKWHLSGEKKRRKILWK